MTDSPGRLKPTGGRPYQYALFLILCSVFLSLLVGEIIIRTTKEPLDLWILTGRTAGLHRSLHWSFADPYAAFRAKPGIFHNGKTVNSHGFISTPKITAAKKKGTIRLAFMGGSAVAGIRDTADEETWPWQVITLLKERFPEQEFDFINAALGHYTLFESYGRLWSRVRFFSPDITILYHGWNDMQYFKKNAVRNIERRLAPQHRSWSHGVSQKKITVYAPMAIDYLIRPSQLLTYFRIKWSSPVADELAPKNREPLSETYHPHGPEIWRTNLQLTRETAKVIDTNLFVVKQATLITDDLPTTLRKKAGIHVHDLSYDAHLRAFEDIYRVIDEEFETEQIIDATPLSGNPDLFIDHIHANEKGQTAIAKLIADALTPVIQAMIEDTP